MARLGCIGWRIGTNDCIKHLINPTKMFMLSEKRDCARSIFALKPLNHQLCRGLMITTLFLETQTSGFPTLKGRDYLRLNAGADLITDWRKASLQASHFHSHRRPLISRSQANDLTLRARCASRALLGISPFFAAKLTYTHTSSSAVVQ